MQVQGSQQPKEAGEAEAVEPGAREEVAGGAGHAVEMQDNPSAEGAAEGLPKGWGQGGDGKAGRTIL